MENKSKGYISIFRSLKTHWLWQDPVKLKWWLDLLLSANYSEQKVLIKGTLYICKRGDTIKSLTTWSTEWRTTRRTVTTFLNLLQKDGMITYRSDKVTTHITICNYDSYNTDRTTKDTTKSPLPAQQSSHNLHTNNKDNKDNKDNKEEIIKEKKYGLKNSEMGKYSQQQIELFDLFYHWMENEAPNTLKMTEPLTLPQYISLRQKYDEPYMKSMFEKMHNYKPLIKNNVSTYKTFQNWAGKDAERKPTINPKNANSFI